MRKLITLFALLALLPFSAYAAVDTIRWVPPATYVDGSTLDPVVDLDEFRVYCDSAQPVAITDTSMTSSPLSSIIDTSVDGSHSCYMTAHSVAMQESGPSNSVAYTCTSGVCVNDNPVNGTVPSAPGSLELIKK